MKKARLSSILIAVLMLAVAVIAEAQQPKKIPRIGFLGALSPSSISARIEAFRQGLRELGYVEGKTSSLSMGGRRGNLIVSPRSRPDSCNSRSRSSPRQPRPTPQPPAQ